MSDEEGDTQGIKVRIRFFARFRDLMGTEIIAEPAPGTALDSLVREAVGRDRWGHQAIFNEDGSFREIVILMRNGKRVDAAEAVKIQVADGDEIAIFPPVSGG